MKDALIVAGYIIRPLVLRLNARVASDVGELDHVDRVVYHALVKLGLVDASRPQGMNPFLRLTGR